MSSSICHHFTQNAWKKDLCSNCFKSKDEHKQAAAAAASKYTGLKTNTFKTTLATTNTIAKMETATQKTDYPNKYKKPAKSIIKRPHVASTTKSSNKHKTHKVCFPKNLSEVIGYGGEWSDVDSDEDDFDFVNIGNERDDLAATSTDDEETIEIKRITRANTDFNMNNGNLLGDPQENIKKSFAALKLGAPQVDKEGKKQTLKINVMPFGATPIGTANANADEPKKTATTTTTTTASVKAKFETKSQESVTESVTKSTLAAVQANKRAATTITTTKSLSLAAEQHTTVPPILTVTAITTSTASAKSNSTLSSDNDDGKNSPPIERAMEKSLLDEISETLEKQKQNESKQLAESKNTITTTTSSLSTAPTTTTNSSAKIKFEITSLSDSLENKTFLEFKKPIARNPPITKDHAKPKVNVFHKYSDTDSNCSDSENGVSAYYDVVETQISYENLPDGKYSNLQINNSKPTEAEQKSVYSSSQYITDMLLSSKTRAASYNLHEGNFMTSKITSDGLIVTKCSSDDALDSTGSSFDGSSDEETSYNMIRSESDSGIGISIGNEYKNINVVKERIEKKLSASTNNSDYEDIQIGDQAPVLTAKTSTGGKTTKSNFSLDKSRELHGEPDGSADPDGSLEAKEINRQSSLPALPNSPPPTKTIDARPSFLHGLQKQHAPMLLKKPDLPAKPLVSPVHTPLKTFMSKRLPTNAEQQVINQLQNVMNKNNNEQLDNTADSTRDDAKQKKGKAPNPPPDTKSSAPPTPERDYSLVVEFEAATKREEDLYAHNTQQTDQQSQLTTVLSKNNANQSQSATAETALPTNTANNSKTTSISTATVITTSASLYTRKTSATSGNNLSNNNSNNNNNNNSNSGSSNSNSKATASSPVIREKDKRERATINPKFRSLNTFVMHRANAAKNLQLQSGGSVANLKQTMTPEPTPRNYKNLSLSQECLANVKGATTSSATKTITASIPNLVLASASTGTGHDKKSSPHSSPITATATASTAAVGAPTTTTATTSSTITLATQSIKPKAKFSIKKFLRMGASKTADNLHKKDSIYTEICTGDDGNTVGKPRLVIIHPIDINPTAVEVVKDITKTNDAVTAQTIAVVTSKPPAPPLRTSNDGQRAHEINKPARPPPPKSAELRRKQQKIALSTTTTGSCNNDATDGNGNSAADSIKCKSDNVYANLGEIRSSIAPRKPERTASMREREAQLELARKRHGGSRNENADTISICSSNGENVTADATTTMQLNGNSNSNNVSVTDASKPPTGSRTSTFEKIKKSDAKIAISNKLELFEQRNQNPSKNETTMASNNNTISEHVVSSSRPSSLKDSVRKINSTIDSYLKDKRDFENLYEMIKSPSSPPPPPARSVDFATTSTEMGATAAALSATPAATTAQRLLPNRRNNLFSDTASLASYTRSEYGPTTRTYGFHNSLANIPRIISASYCGSEVGEFDIYAPYSYYGSETGGDVATDINDSVWGIPSAIKNRTKATNRLRMRKGRSVVHKNIEDNYTAVVVANHEALAQVLDQLQQTPIIPPALRPLANAINLRFEDFTIIDGAQAFVVGKKAFHAAVWTTAPVTLALSADCNQLAGVGGELNQLTGGISGVLNPITEFCDIVPSYHLPLMPSTEVQMLQATISVLPRLQLDTLQTIGAILKGKSQVLDKSNFNFRGSIPNLTGIRDSTTATTTAAATTAANILRNVMSVQNLTTLNEESSLDLNQQRIDNMEVSAGDSTAATTTAASMPAFDDVMTREVAFIVLQLINGMKHLQAKAIEDMPLSLSNVVLSKDMENKDAQARLCVLQGNNNDEDEPMGTLCKCAHIALTEMLPTTKITQIVANILQQERAESLSKVKSVLEFVLWGPSDVVLTGTTKERELALQRWLDLERATVLHGLVRTRVELTVYDECHLMFLVRSTAKIMNDAAKIVCSYQQHQQQLTEPAAKTQNY